MKQGLNYALFGGMVAIAAGLIGAYGMPDFSENESSLAAAQMLGHVTMIHTDADGNVIGYQQSDNLIVNRGEDCVLKQVFGSANTEAGAYLSDIIPTGSTTCGTDLGSRAGVFEDIAIGNGSSVAGVDETDTALFSEHNVTGNDSGLTRAEIGTSTKVYSAETDSSRVVLSGQFTNTYGAGLSYDVTESAIFNSTETAGASTVDADTMMFARQTFSAITLDNGESLTVEWTVDVGGTTTLAGAEPT